MIPNPTRKVLFSMKKNGVKALLMGGQACVYYGAAEFSKDVDFAVGVEADNIAHLQEALDELEAHRIAVPPFDVELLKRGHAVHFRCARADVRDLRVDVMSKMRGVDSFFELWERRTTGIGNEEEFELMSLPDLVKAKKTQRDKDWPMIRRLVEAHYFEFRNEPSTGRIAFWLQEARTPTILMTVATQFPEAQVEREAATLARNGADKLAIEAALKAEEERERAADRSYWAPLRVELEQLRRECRAP